MMSNEKFKTATNLRNCIRILESLAGDVELCRHNDSVGYRALTYNVSETDLKVLGDSLGNLNDEETETLKELYL